MAKEEIKSISPLISQMTLRTLGSYCSTQIGNDVYYLIRAINLMKSDLGEEEIKKEWEAMGRNWGKTKKALEKLEKKSIAVKNFYDAIEDKRFEKKDKEIKIKKFYIKTASKIPVLIPEAYDLLVMMIKKTQIQRQTIPSEAFKILEHAGYKKIEIGKKSPQAEKSATSETSQSSE